MLRSVHFPPFSHRAAWLLVLGLLTMALHALAATGLMQAVAGKGDTFAAELCTSHGLIKAGSAPTPNDGSPTTGVHDCCKLCAADGPLLPAGLALGIAPAPTFATLHDSRISARPTLAVRTAHPPRGPPARA